MKKISIIIILITLIFAYTYVYANDTISISNIEIADISDNTIINEEPTISGLSFSMDVTFFEVNDFIKYKIEVENNSNDDLIISDDIKFNNNDYITYEYSIDGDSIIKANSKKIMYVTATYKKEVVDSLFENDTYQNKENMQLNISNIIENPKTGHSNLVLSIISMIMILFGIYMVVKYGKKDQIMVIIICLSLIPISVFAIEKIKLTISTNIIIEKNTETFKICSFTNREQCSTYRHKTNMTWGEWLESKYNYNNVNFREDDYICNSGKVFLVIIDNTSSIISIKYNDYIEEDKYYIGISSRCDY